MEAVEDTAAEYFAGAAGSAVVAVAAAAVRVAAVVDVLSAAVLSAAAPAAVETMEEACFGSSDQDHLSMKNCQLSSDQHWASVRYLSDSLAVGRSCYQMLCADDLSGTVVLLLDLGRVDSPAGSQVVVGTARVVCTERQRYAEKGVAAVEDPFRVFMCVSDYPLIEATDARDGVSSWQV